MNKKPAPAKKIGAPCKGYHDTRQTPAHLKPGYMSGVLRHPSNDKKK